MVSEFDLICLCFFVVVNICFVCAFVATVVYVLLDMSLHKANQTTKIAHKYYAYTRDSVFVCAISRNIRNCALGEFVFSLSFVVFESLFICWSIVALFAYRI